MVKIHLGQLTLESPAFLHGERLPDELAASDSGPPPLSWRDAPEGTQSFALVCHDPDAPLTYGFTHWVIYGIPADCTGLPEGGKGEYRQGVNGLGEPTYMPPGPPPGHGDHFYYFHLYALDQVLDLPDGLTQEQLLAAIDDHILEQARIVGTWSNSTEAAS
jgi:Raf kinase inhibitor-like YbhB/YbcL family protein